jgi:uncharacterized damage-inducible protein DinB
MDLASTFIARSRHYLVVEYRTKLHTAVLALPPDALWARANEASNSVGNLLVHLAGNVRQWIVDGVGREPSLRNRAAEFAVRDGPRAEVLLRDLDSVLRDVDRILGGLTHEELLTDRTIQGRDITVFEAIYHVVEHFSLHLGQVVLMAKAHAPGSFQFYEDAEGMATAVWMNATLPAVENG